MPNAHHQDDLRSKLHKIIVALQDKSVVFTAVRFFCILGVGLWSSADQFDHGKPRRLLPVQYSIHDLIPVIASLPARHNLVPKILGWAPNNVTALDLLASNMQPFQHGLVS